MIPPPFFFFNDSFSLLCFSRRAAWLLVNLSEFLSYGFWNITTRGCYYLISIFCVFILFIFSNISPYRTIYIYPNLLLHPSPFLLRIARVELEFALFRLPALFFGFASKYHIAYPSNIAEGDITETEKKVQEIETLYSS